MRGAVLAALVALGCTGPAAETPPVGPRTLEVRAGGDLAAALREARPGDVVALEAGATFEGPFELPAKPGADWIVLTTSAPERLPAPGTRIDPSFAPALPKLVSESEVVLRAAPGAHHWRLVGLELGPTPGAWLYNVLELGATSATPAELPHHVVVERCYLHGDPRRGSRRGIALNSSHTEVLDSWIADFKDTGAEAQAIAGWSGPGPFRIVNNYLEGAAQGVLFGGADPAIAGLVPSDIEFLQNHVSRPLAWRQGDPAFAGSAWQVKNLFELKNARRVRIEGNLFERNWADAQNGFAILFTVRNQDGHAPWATIEDVIFRNNVVRHVGAGINLLGHDDAAESGRARRIRIENNLFFDVDGRRWGGPGTLFQLLDGTAEVVIEHNTGLQSGNVITADGAPHTGFVYRDNLTLHNENGMFGSGHGVGNAALAHYFPRSIVRGNVLVGGSGGSYPAGNFFPGSLRDVLAADTAEATDVRLVRSSPFKGRATDGKDPGVDSARLGAALGSSSR